MSRPQQNEIYLPDTMAKWPWPRRINPLYQEMKAGSDIWLKSFKPFTSESQSIFDSCDFEHLRTACDLMNVLFVLDEYTDVESAPGVREIADIVLDALQNPSKRRQEGEILLGEMARQFWERAIQTATVSSQKHFIEAFASYLDGVVAHAVVRGNGTIQTFDEYLKIRREDVGVRVTYSPFEFGLNIPDEVFYHPIIVEISECGVDLTIIDNDIASYNKEQAAGDDDFNSLTIIMRQLDVDLASAIDWVVDYHAQVQARFLSAFRRVPSFGGEVDRDVEQYILGIANWIRSNHCWSFEGGRYFGRKGLEIQSTRRVPLLPKAKHDRTLKRQQVIIPAVDI
ncbi:terpenoid synthase [Wolfiporia cocos MD-104 SS10]|uniref:Terpene synthase n=1 Tax=Wolfiporia cocos (strain MD-104) TaxID=742152 RepID=A0A2H3JJT5_WOLCO|nr:terpenoid synthase [Wolfiporia cocos MD-104 SS10]